MSKKLISDYKHVSKVTAKALIYEGKPAGRIIANWSDNPSGSVCSASVIVWGGSLGHLKNEKTGVTFNYANVGKAGGYGYDKLSQAVWQCFENVGIETLKVKPANGLTNEEFEAWGYVVADVC
jgi:hypothetical protein